MDFGIDPLVYIIIGVIFVLAKATQKNDIVKVFFEVATLRSGLTAKQACKSVHHNSVPPVFTEPADFQRSVMVLQELVFLKSSFHDPGDRALAGSFEPALTPDADHSFSAFDLRPEVVYSVILEPKYV